MLAKSEKARQVGLVGVVLGPGAADRMWILVCLGLLYIVIQLGDRRKKVKRRK